MFCKYCGKELSDNALFCSKCGKQVTSTEESASELQTENEPEQCKETEAEIEPQDDETEKKSEVESAEEKHKFCRYCGEKILESSVFCPKCGKHLAANHTTQGNNVFEKFGIGGKSEKTDFSVKFPVKNLFINVLKRHTVQERDEVLKAGMDSEKNPGNIKITEKSLCPWFYSRIFIILFAVFIIFEICLMNFNNSNVMPGVMIIGSLMMPFAILTMFFELNIYRDVSFFKVIGIFLLGGSASLLFTLFLYTIIPSGNGYGLIGASIISITEEIGKTVIVIAILKRSKNMSVLKGLLIGGAVGAGFAVFESAGYAFNIFLDAHDYNNFYYGYVDSLGQMNFTIFLRSILSFGGHTAWAAIEGAAFAREKKINKAFVKVFGLCFALHAIWDMNTPLQYLKLILLCLVAWWTILRQLGKFIAKNK